MSDPTAQISVGPIKSSEGQTDVRFSYRCYANYVTLKLLEGHWKVTEEAEIHDPCGI